MKKIFTTIYVMLSLLLCGVAQAQTVTIGTGTSTQRQPLGCWFGYERSTAIYSGSEIGRSGSITKIRWYVNATGTNSTPTKIYLKMVPDSTFTAATTYATEIAGATLVYDSSKKLTAGGWQEFVLSTSFAYSNARHLEVIVETNYGGGGFGNINAIRYTTSGTNTHQNWSQDNTAPTGTGTRNASRPNIQLDLIPFPFPDLAVTTLLSPALNCSSGSYNLKYRIVNGSTVTLPSGAYIRYSYKLNSGAVVLDSFQLTSDLANGNTRDITINGINTVGLTNMTFLVTVDNNLDQLKINNSATFLAANVNCISKDTANNFETSDFGFSGQTPWVRARLNKSPFNVAPGGTIGWVTDSTNQYLDNTNASLSSGYLNFSNTCTPIFEWDMRYDTEVNWDAVILEISTDNINWTKVSSITPAYGNTSASGPMPPPKYSGDNGTWERFTADLSAWRGQPAVRVRLRFASDGSGVDNGIAIDNVRFDLVSNYTGATYTGPDTVFVNSLYDTEFGSTSPNQTGAAFSWELDGVQIIAGKPFSYSFPTAGNHTLKFVVKDNCGTRLDSFSKTIVVINPTKKPVADFIADVYTPGLLDLVTFSNLSTNGPTYEWIISPELVYDPDLGFSTPTYYYQNGTNVASKTPVVAFYYGGQYDVCLVATNSVGSDTTCKTQYIIVGQTNLTGTDSLMCNGSISTATSGRVYDSGGPNGAYQDNENCVFTIDFNCYDSLRLRWNSFDLEDGFDYLQIYDGDDVSGTPLWDAAAEPQGITGTGIPRTTDFFAFSGKVTLVMSSDVSLPQDGFSLSYEMINPKGTPDASFEVADTVCAGYTTNFANTSRSGTSYEWDYFGTGTTMGTAKEGVFAYATAGTYNVRLIVKNCVGADTFVKTVEVVHPASMATNFSADKVKATTNDIITFTDSTKGCVDDYQWEITPATYTVKGGSLNSPKVALNFTQPGFYDIKLITTNTVTSDSIVKTAFIEITPICMPAIGNSIQDMGISRVAFADLSNNTPGGKGYTDFPTMAANVTAGATYSLAVDRPTVSNQVSRMVWIDYNADGDFSDAGELVAQDGPGRTKTLSAMITIPRSAYIGMVTMRVSTAYGSNLNDPCGNRTFGETQDYRINIKVDRTLPVITLIGSPSIIINVNDSYSDAGATALDNLDGNLTPFIVTTNPVVTTTPGTYTIEYNVTDSAGNAAITVKREVIVLPDAPVITILGKNPDTLDVYTRYFDPGVDAIDYNAQPINFTANSTVDSSRVGPYTITYSATDANGRTTSVSRTVVVVDRVAPTATLIGKDTVTIEVFGTFNDPGLTLSDNYCTPGQITYTTQSVSYDVIGFKTIVYNVTDCNGNTSTVSRTVKVVDTQAPVIHLNGDVVVNLYRLRTFTDEGYSLSDNYYPNSAITVEAITNLVSTEIIGLYTLRYKATDGSGNVSYSETRFIYIIDNVGVSDVEILKMNVYPNPARSAVTVAADGFEGENVQIILTDMYGRTVSQQEVTNFSGETTISLNDYASGVYMITLVNGNRQATARVIVNK